MEYNKLNIINDLIVLTVLILTHVFNENNWYTYLIEMPFFLRILNLFKHDKKIERLFFLYGK